MGWRAPVLLFAAVVVLVLAVTTSSTLPARFDVTPIAKADVDRRLEAATVSLVSLGCDLSLDSGTGVAVAEDRVATNRHVTERFRSLHLVYDGTPPRMLTRIRKDVSVSPGLIPNALRATTILIWPSGVYVLCASAGFVVVSGLVGLVPSP